MIGTVAMTATVAEQSLPGGATTSLTETHGDWTVACVAPEGVARCAITQTQVSGENRQWVLGVELTAAEGGVASGVLGYRSGSGSIPTCVSR